MAVKLELQCLLEAVHIQTEWRGIACMWMDTHTLDKSKKMLDSETFTRVKFQIYNFLVTFHRLMNIENDVASGEHFKSEIETKTQNCKSKRADFRDKGRCQCKAFLSLTQSISVKNCFDVSSSLSEYNKPVCSLLAFLPIMGYLLLNAQLCCMWKCTYSPIKKYDKPKGWGTVVCVWWKSEKDRQSVFSPVVSSPTRYKDTGNRSTSWQQRSKTGREEIDP